MKRMADFKLLTYSIYFKIWYILKYILKYIHYNVYTMYILKYIKIYTFGTGYDQQFMKRKHCIMV